MSSHCEYRNEHLSMRSLQDFCTSQLLQDCYEYNWPFAWELSVSTMECSKISASTPDAFCPSYLPPARNTALSHSSTLASISSVLCIWANPPEHALAPDCLSFAKQGARASPWWQMHKWLRARSGIKISNSQQQYPYTDFLPARVGFVKSADSYSLPNPFNK